MSPTKPPTHKPHGDKPRRSYDRQYDRHRRAPGTLSAQVEKWRSTARWHKLRDSIMGRDEGVCQHCKNSVAHEVHHIHPPNEADSTKEAYWRMWEPDGLVALCIRCHRKADAKERRHG